MEVREATEGDLEAIRQIYNHYVENTHVTFDLEPVDLDNRRQWFSQFNRDESHRLFVGVAEGRICGYTSSSWFRVKPAYDRSVETTIYLAPDATGQGYGRILYRHLLDELRATQVHRCYGVIALPNDASVSLHRQLGFQDAGRLTEVGFKFNQYWDTLWLELQL